MTKNLPRPEFFRLENGDKAPLPFTAKEYENRLSALRALMRSENVPAVLLTSMHNIAYYSGFLYCSFGRPYGCVVTEDRCTTISANIDLSQPWRRCHGDNIIYTDWKRDNYHRAVKHALGGETKVGIEGDHLTLQSLENLKVVASVSESVDLAGKIMALR